MIIILTKKPKESAYDCKYFFHEIKHLVRNIIRGKRGPEVVIEQLKNGLRNELISFQIDPPIKNIDLNSDIWVIKDVLALKFAIKMKKGGLIKKLIAGPNIVVTPDENEFLLFDEAIDKIIVPSLWVKDLYSSFEHKNSRLNDKIEIWPSGIDLYPVSRKESGFGIVYKKDIPNEIFEEVISNLKEKGKTYKVIDYGKFKQKEYFNLLEKSSWLIYLQNIESQGMAMFEAWAHDVPTLIFENKKYQYKNISVEGKISAPYLNGQSGMFFDKDNLKEKMDLFFNNLGGYKPKKYVEENFSTKICVKKIIDIISS